MDPETLAKVKQITSLMDPVMEDRGVPRNIKRILEESKERLLDENADPTVSIATAIYNLEEISNDINLPAHMRTEIWNMVSELERLKEELK